MMSKYSHLEELAHEYETQITYSIRIFLTTTRGPKLTDIKITLPQGFPDKPPVIRILANVKHFKLSIEGYFDHPIITDYMPGTSLVDIIKKMVEEFEKKPIKYLNTKETNEKLKKELDMREEELKTLDEMNTDLQDKNNRLKDDIEALKRDWDMLVTSRVHNLPGSDGKELFEYLVPATKFEDLKEFESGSNVVYFYQEKSSGKRYAVKTFNTNEAEGRQFAIEEFKNMLKCYDSPYVVTPLQLAYNRQKLCILMEDGGICLNKYWLDRKINLRNCARFFAKMAFGLKSIHERNMYHGDVKPQNILIKGEKVLFSDFGSSILFKDPRNFYQTKRTIGGLQEYTMAYLAPEVAYCIANDCMENIKPVSYAKLDVYALCLTMYSFLTKHLVTPDEVVKKNKNDAVLYLGFIREIEMKIMDMYEDNKQQDMLIGIIKIIINGLHINIERRLKLDDIIFGLKKWIK